MSCSLLFTSAYLNSVRVDTEIGGKRLSGVAFVGVDGGIYEFVFGSRVGSFKLLLVFDFVVCFGSGPDGDDNSPFFFQENKKDIWKIGNKKKSIKNKN